jgi:hypothetical protein
MHVNEGEGGGASMMTRRQKHIMNDDYSYRVSDASRQMQAYTHNCSFDSPIELVRMTGTKKNPGTRR